MIKETARSIRRKDNLPEKQQYRRHLWNMLFMELLLQKMQEKELEAVFEPWQKTKNTLSCELSIHLTEENEEKGCWPSMGRDSFQLTWYCFESMLESEDYANLAGNVKRTGYLASSRLFGEAREILRDYYRGQMDATLLSVFYRQYCLIYVRESKEKGATEKRKRLTEVYEYFARANARQAVQMNRREGRRLVEGSGLTWAGTTYYNADYYFEHKKVDELLQKITQEAAMELEIPCVDFEGAKKKNRFYLDGGISYHGVFTWMQMQNNFPSGQYGLRSLKKEPPENFIYLYRNGCCEAEKKGIRRLEMRLRNLAAGRNYGNELWRSYCTCSGNAYHNGRSYLLDWKRNSGEEEELYGKAMDFLDTFRLYRISGCVEILSVGC